MQRIIKYLDFIIYWSMVLLPFSVAISNAPTNVFMGFLIFAYIIKKILKRETLFAKTAINIPLLILFLLICLSLINSINYRDSIKGGVLRLLQYYLTFFILATQIKDKQHIKKVIFSMVAGILLVSVDAIWQVLTGRDFIRGYEAIVNLRLVRVTASFKDANLLGIYLSAFAPLILGLALYYYKNKKKLIFAFMSLFALIGIILTYSRPTLLAVYLALFFLGIVRRDRVLIGLLIILTLVSPFILPASIKKWAKEMEYNPIRFMCNDDRIAVYRNSFHMIKDHPLIGVGANTYMKNYKKYKENPEYRNIITKDYMYAHNNFIHMAAETGLFSLGVFMWLLYRLFRECKRIYSYVNDNYIKLVLLSLIACLMAFLVNGLTESSLYYSRVAIIFWYLMGLALSFGKFINEKQTQPS